jgi:hypothetical protein
VAPAAARGGAGAWEASRAGPEREWGRAWTGAPGHDRAISQRAEAAGEKVVEGEEPHRGAAARGPVCGAQRGEECFFFMRIWVGQAGTRGWVLGRVDVGRFF